MRMRIQYEKLLHHIQCLRYYNSNQEPMPISSRSSSAMYVTCGNGIYAPLTKTAIARKMYDADLAVASRPYM